MKILLNNIIQFNDNHNEIEKRNTKQNGKKKL